jgi:hypothetical protein
MIAADLRKRRLKPHTTWYLDEVYLKIDGRMVYLWRAVDAEGEVLDALVQSKRSKPAALRLMRTFCSSYPALMARDFITLSDMPQSVLGIECSLCQRHEQFDVEALKVQHGADVKMPELLSRLAADCPRQGAYSIYDRCRAVYDQRSRYKGR